MGDDTRLALVSGGSRGIGRAIVRRLAEDGYDISFCYRSDEESANAVAKEVAELGRRALAVRTDVADVDSAREWVVRTGEELGAIDVVVTSAGITRDNPLALMADSDWQSVIRTNLDGVYNVCRPAVFDMMKRRTGCVVTLSSVSGVYGNPSQSNYSASKAGIIGFTKALAKEVGKFGIRANTVAPGLIQTDMIDEMPQKKRDKLLGNIPLGRFGRAEEIADLVSFLASERATYITGSVLEIHGGMTLMAAEDWDAIVIGAGMGGLTCAAYLAASGRRVLVLEQHDVAGGNAQMFRRRRAYQFDVGTHYLGDCGDGGVLPAILSGLGVADRVSFHPMDPDCYDRIVMPNASVDVPTGWDRFRERLFAALPEDVAGLATFLDICAACARGNRARLLDPPESDISGLSGDVVRWSRRTLAQLFDHCGLSHRARALLSAQLGNYGSTPSETLVVAHASMVDDYLRGAYYPVGGGQTIVAAMVEVLEAHDGELWTRAMVTRVVIEDGAARGVVLDDGRELRAPVVVSNADFRRTALDLCAGAFPKPVVDRTVEAPMRLGLATLYVILDTVEPRPNTNLWWWETDDVEGAFDAMRVGEPEPQFVILTFASVKDPLPAATCPPGHTNFQIMTLCPPDYAIWGMSDGPTSGERYRRTPVYREAKQRFADRMLDMAERAIGPFRDRITYLESATPLTQERYTLSSGGTPYGIGRWGNTSMRPDVRTAVAGLYLAGQNTRYGGGIVGASVSGMACASAILDRALLPAVHKGEVLVDPARLPRRGPDFDPLRISRGLARRDARGMQRLGAPA